MTNGDAKALTTLSWLVLGGFVLLVALVLLVPLYTDEVTATMLSTRPFTDGARTFSLLPHCTKSWSAPLPLVWYPASAVYWLAFTPLGLLGYRISSLVVAAAWLGGLAWTIARVTRRRDEGVRRMALFVAPLAVGTVPLALVTARQEPVMIAAVCAYVGLPLFASIATRRTRLGRALVTLAFVLITSIFTFVHTKSLLFAPFLLVSLFATFTRKRPAWLLLALALTTVMLGETYRRAKFLAVCDEAPKTQAVLQSLSSNPRRIVEDPIAFARTAVENMGHLAEGVRLEPEATWLPHEPRTVPTFVKVADRATGAILWGYCIAVPLFVGIVALRTFRRKRARVPLALAVALLVTTFAVLVITRSWAFYASPMIIALLGLATTLALPFAPHAVPARLRARARPLARAALGLLFLVVAANVATTLIDVGPLLVADARRDGTVVPGQPAGVRVFGYSKERDRIRAHAASCGIRGDGAKRLVVDDATLFAFEDLKEPLHLIYVTDATYWGLDMAGNLDLALFARLQTPGIISRCAFFPTRLVRKAKKADEYCCVGADDFLPPKLATNTRLGFSGHDDTEPFLLAGWSWGEETGRWSTGDRSTVFFTYDSSGQAKELGLEVATSLGGSRHAQDVDVLVNSVALGTLRFRDGDNDPTTVRRLAIPPSALHDGTNEIAFHPHDVRTPRMLGISADDRALGVWLRALWLE